MSDFQRLPMEIILQVLDSTLDEPSRIYSPIDAVTKTLLSFTLVCRATRARASNHLRRQCMYIDDEKRLRDCIVYLKASQHEVNNEIVVPFASASRLEPISSIYLALFEDWSPSVDASPMAKHIIELCSLIRPTLRRLILNIDFNFFAQYSYDEYTADLDYTRASRAVFNSLYAAFSSLTALEDFVNLKDSYYFPSSPLLGDPWEGNDFVWNSWPNLRHLALHAADIPSNFWQQVGKAEKLGIVILARPYGYGHNCLKTQILDNDNPESPSADPADSTTPPFKVIFAAESRGQPRDRTGRCWLEGVASWPSIDPDNLIQVSLYDLPAPPNHWAADSAGRECVKMSALRDEIWDWQGEVISG